MAVQSGAELDATGHRYCVVAARFNETYVRRLVEAALEVLRGRGAVDTDLEVVWVPGSFELPLACRWAALTGRFDAVLAFGVLIQGETEHFRLVADVSTKGLQEVAVRCRAAASRLEASVIYGKRYPARTLGRFFNFGDHPTHR